MTRARTGSGRHRRLAAGVFAASVGVVVYTFVGYPAILAAWARLRPRPVRSDPSHRPRISVIIAAYNEEDEIAGRIENVQADGYPADRLEVIVACDGSDDRTMARAARFEGVRILHQPERAGKLAAITRAAAEATGEILVFTDANNRFVRGTLAALIAPFADHEVGVVAGRKAIDDDSGRAIDRVESGYWKYEAKIKTWESLVGSTIGAAGEIIAFRRDAFIVPKRRIITEDLVQAILAAADGWRVVYAPDAVSLERASATVEDEATRRARLVTGRFQALALLLPRLVIARPRLAWQFVSHKGLRPFVPSALLLMAVLNPPLARHRRWTGLALLGQVAFYSAAAGGWAAERSGRRVRALFVPYYFCRMNMAALKGTRDFLTGRADVAWEKVRRG
jgi:cellulose synthase/poly-beta-1,6-N-acetylglucosamine synthase-like glycosyltransferase